VLETFTIAPRPWRRIDGMTAWHIRIVPITSTSSNAAAAAVLMCSKRTVSASSSRPAVFTSTSIRPYSPFARCTNPSTDAWSVTSS
jgi:hypothetical protein